MDASPISADLLACRRQELPDRIAEQVLKHTARVRVRLGPDIPRIPALPLARRNRQLREIRVAVARAARRNCASKAWNLCQRRSAIRARSSVGRPGSPPSRGS